MNGLRAAMLVPLLACATAPAAAQVTFALDGATMVPLGTDRTPLDPTVLAGATLRFGDAGSGIYVVRIDAVFADDPRGRPMLYDLSVQAPGSDAWQKLCSPDPQGHTTAIPVPGTWHDHRFVPGALSFACTSGARGKCLRAGYLPWQETAAGESMAPYHAACTRMMRADYCGDGTPHTIAGRRVQLLDRIGIAPPAGTAFGSFEAAWGPDGAHCVAHARTPDFPLRESLRNCPERANAQPCTEDLIGTLPGALLGNRS